MSAWTATPSVAPPARIATIVGVQTGDRCPYGSAPNATMNTISMAIATTLLTTGAQVNGPNDLRALRTSPSRV